MPSVSDESVFLTAGPALIQNLGSDSLFVADVNPATSDNGVQISSGQVVIVGAGESFYGISVGTSDVRILSRGSGFFDGTAPS